jgi:hypothetical protein
MSIDMKTWVFDFRNRNEIKILGSPTSPCVKRFVAYESPHTTNSEKFPNISKHLIIM